MPIFFRFCFDPFAKVAQTASLSLAEILKSLESDVDNKPEKIIKVVRKYFYRSQTFKRRQLYVIMCGQVIKEDIHMFNKYFKGDLTSLALDKVITVRMAVARLLMSCPEIAGDSEI